MKSPVSLKAPFILSLFASTNLVHAVPSKKSEPSNGPDASGWYQLFNGKDLSGWTPSENKHSCKVENGSILVHGPRSHLFYTGTVHAATFKDFELIAEVLTTPGSNSGIYFRTKFQERGWPNRGYEAQINNTHPDYKKTGSLYAVCDKSQSPVQDNRWFTCHITVLERSIRIQIDGKTITEYTEPRFLNRPHRQLGDGTIALQSHDENSKVYFRMVDVKPLDPMVIAGMN
jgi:hypothetical protein